MPGLDNLLLAFMAKLNLPVITRLLLFQIILLITNGIIVKLKYTLPVIINTSQVIDIPKPPDAAVDVPFNVILPDKLVVEDGYGLKYIPGLLLGVVPLI